MNKIKILVDSCSDMSKEWREKYDIDYLPLNVIIGTEEKIADLNWEEYSPKEYYNYMRGKKRVLSNQVPQTVFEKEFNRYLDEGYDIIYIGCSSGLSGSVATGTAVAKEILKTRPEAKIHCIDPRISGGGQALIAIETAKLIEKGADLETAVAAAKEMSTRIYQNGTVDSLEFLKMAGRVKASAAFFGNLLGIKPILIRNGKGENIAVKKVRGKKAAMDECVNMLKEQMCYEGQPYPASEQTAYVGHTDCIEDAEYLKEQIMQKIAPKECYINYVGPAIGASVGPGMVILFGFGKPIVLDEA